MLSRFNCTNTDRAGKAGSICSRFEFPGHDHPGGEELFVIQGCCVTSTAITLKEVGFDRLWDRVIRRRAGLRAACYGLRRGTLGDRERPFEPVELDSEQALWDWLEANHQRAEGVWFITYKNQS